MASWILKLPFKVIQFVKTNKRLSLELFLAILTAFSVCGGIYYYRQNKSLSEGLNDCKNNIEFYQNALNGEILKNNTLLLTVQDLLNSNDSLVQDMVRMAKENKIKIAKLSSAATQTQSLSVSGGKGVIGDIIEVLKDTTYSDSIRFNDETVVGYTISKDTVDILLDIHNTLYLYTFKQKQYKNKKSFLKRLFTLDFKKVWRYRYEIINTNDLILTSDVRVIDITEK